MQPQRKSQGKPPRRAEAGNSDGSGMVEHLALEQIDGDLEALALDVHRAEWEVFEVLRRQGEGSEPTEDELSDIEAGMDGLVALKAGIRELREEAARVLAAL